MSKTKAEIKEELERKTILLDDTRRRLHESQVLTARAQTELADARAEAAELRQRQKVQPSPFFQIFDWILDLRDRKIR